MRAGVEIVQFCAHVGSRCNNLVGSTNGPEWLSTEGGSIEKGIANESETVRQFPVHRASDNCPFTRLLTGSLQSCAVVTLFERHTRDTLCQRLSCVCVACLSESERQPFFGDASFGNGAGWPAVGQFCGLD